MDRSMAASSEDDYVMRMVDDRAFNRESSVAFSDWQASVQLNPSTRDAAMSKPALEEHRPGARPGPAAHKTPMAPVAAGSAKFYTPPVPRHIFENVPQPLHRTAGGKLGADEWENEIARNVLALYRADVTKRAGAGSSLAAHLAYREEEGGLAGTGAGTALPSPVAAAAGRPRASRTAPSAARAGASGRRAAGALPSATAAAVASTGTCTSDDYSSSRGDSRLAEGDSLSLGRSGSLASASEGGWRVGDEPSAALPLRGELSPRLEGEGEEGSGSEAEGEGGGAAGAGAASARTLKKKKKKRSTGRRLPVKPPTPDPPKPMHVPGPPTNRHGTVLPTIAGGAGGSHGHAKLRGGPYPVWFGGSGAPVSSRTVWCGLAGVAVPGMPPELSSEQIMVALASGQCIHSLCNALAALERGGQYSEYLEVLVGLLLKDIRLQIPRSEVLARQWRQLLAAGVVFGLNYIEEGRFGPALLMLSRVQALVTEDLHMPSGVARELKAFAEDALAFYYYSRGKYQVALQCSNKAMKAHATLGQWQHVAKCQLHTGVLLSRLRQHGEAVRANAQVLQMVDEGKLEGDGADGEKVCMIAVCYHNSAVDHLLMQQVHEACVASQNARRLARLCMAYSNRYMRFFEATHGAALEALARTQPVKESFQSKEDRKLFKNLSADLYS